VFGALFNQRGQGIEDFPLFLIIGQLMFNFFRESTTMAMESVLKNGPLLRKVYIPKYIFPLEKCCFALVNFFFSLVALFIVALLTWSHISIGTVLLAIYPLVMLFIFSLGIGLILSTLYVFVRDIMHIWEVFCTLLVYGSAIFYDPRQMESWMQYVINLNPIYWYITAVRSCVMWGEGLTPPPHGTVCSRPWPANPPSRRGCGPIPRSFRRWRIRCRAGRSATAPMAARWL